MKINYTHYNNYVTKFKQSFGEVKSDVENFILKLRSITDNGVIEGKIHDELLIFVEQVNNIPGFIDDVNVKLENMVKAYLDEMNDAQCIDGEYILYPEYYSKTRDYTDESFESMEGVCDSSDHDANIFQEIIDWGEDIVTKAIYYLGDTFNWFNVRQTQLAVMEINDITRQRLREIQNRLKQRELRYSMKVDEISICLKKLNEYVQVLTEVMCSDIEGFSMDSFISRLNSIYSDMVGSLEAIDFDDNVNEEDIIAFAELNESVNFFDESSSLIFAYLRDLSMTEWYDVDFWKMTVTQQFDIASHELRYIFGEDYDYDDYLLDQQNLALINEIAETKTFDESASKEALDTYKTFMEYIDKYGDEWEKKLEGVRNAEGKLILDKRTSTYKIFKETFDQFGRAEKILSYGSDLCEILATICADYNKNLEILSSLERNNGNISEEMAASLARLRSEYEKTVGSIAANIYEKVSEYGVKFLTKNIDKLFKFGAFSAVGILENVIGVSGEITGISSEAEAMTNLLTSGYSQMNTAKSAYENALNAVREASPQDENYSQLLTDLENCFDFYKTTQKTIFEKMAMSSEGTKKDYYNYCAEELGDLSIANYEDFNLMSYETYVAL